MNESTAGYFVRRGMSIRDAMKVIDRNAKGVALLVDDLDRLIATITDGDIRRAILKGVHLDQEVDTLGNPHPVTAPAGASEFDLMDLMGRHGIRQIPLLDDKGTVVAVSVQPDLLGQADLPIRAVIMAGGFGVRMRPLTDEIPKPMLPVAARPLLEHMVERIRSAGIQKIHMTTHYKPGVIKDHFGDGSNFGVEINYLDEEQPLGTAGSLSMLKEQELDRPLLVLNGDILTAINFRSLLDFHLEHNSAMTVVVKEYEVSIPYGVAETAGDGFSITRIAEKPSFRYFINAGIYMINPEVCRLLTNGGRCDMPELVNRLVAGGQRVVSFPVSEYWLDIGRMSDYERATADVFAGHV